MELLGRKLLAFPSSDKKKKISYLSFPSTILMAHMTECVMGQTEYIFIQPSPVMEAIERESLLFPHTDKVTCHFLQ